MVPALLVPLLGTAGMHVLGLTLQVTTSIAFLLMFRPTISAVFKGQAPKSFTSLVSLLFALGSFGFIAFSARDAVYADSQAKLWRALCYVAVNVIYVIVGLASYWIIRKHEKAAAHGPRG